MRDAPNQMILYTRALIPQRTDTRAHSVSHALSAQPSSQNAMTHLSIRNGSYFIPATLFYRKYAFLETKLFNLYIDILID